MGPFFFYCNALHWGHASPMTMMCGCPPPPQEALLVNRSTAALREHSLASTTITRTSGPSPHARDPAAPVCASGCRLSGRAYPCRTLLLRPPLLLSTLRGACPPPITPVSLALSTSACPSGATQSPGVRARLTRADTSGTSPGACPTSPRRHGPGRRGSRATERSGRCPGRNRSGAPCHAG